MAALLRTVVYPRHVELGAQMVEFGGWEMPVQYPTGILKEHLATRRQAGLFDVSHMGRFFIGGADALPFLQHALTNNAAALEPAESQYTILADEQGCAIDDAYLYRFYEGSYLLVVNAANREKDWSHLLGLKSQFKDVVMEDHTQKMAMFSLQGPQSKAIITNIVGSDALPIPQRNALSIATYNHSEILIARTGYTGEPLCFELFVPAQHAASLWDNVLDSGAAAIGLGARDTLRLEAGLPLYGHELGDDPSGSPIPIFAISMARFAVSFSPLKSDFVGKAALQRQYEALQTIIAQDQGAIDALPRRVRPIELTGKGIARAGAQLFYQGRPAGEVTSGTMVPMWQFEDRGLDSHVVDHSARRAIGLALIDSRIPDGAEITIEVRKKQLPAVVMPYLLRSEAPPMARPITWEAYRRESKQTDLDPALAEQARHWVQKAVDNTQWRQGQCINLIPSEMTTSQVVRMLSIMDPAGRYAEHKPVKAFADADIFYYQGTDFIAAVEAALTEQVCHFLGCNQAEMRPISGQMANMVVFSAMVDFLNRGDRKVEQRRINRVMNHHIIRGGHLSSQPMGALRDYVRRDATTERPAVVNFPVLPDNPYQVDVEACGPLLDRYRPELIIFGKSMVLHQEPVAPIRKLIDEMGLCSIIMYDMAHVLGLAGPSFQQPFAQGADLVTGSTHKTFFGTQRGLVAADYDLDDNMHRDIWEAVNRRAFPGSTSNHHLGTLLGLLIAAMEMNAYKDQYQPQVIANAKAFAKALKACGLDVAGDPAITYTQTHQVIVEVGYAQGPSIARALERSNIICNYQACPKDEGFTASGALRLGVAEMTRFGMRESDFQSLAGLMADVIVHQKQVRDEVTALRQNFLEMQYCFSTDALAELVQKLHGLI
ncbi:MAG: glycine cleavage system aminomethyltransferase GcvT [Desulfobacteraceae bacterium]|jgi:aminomethyltransferase